MPFLNFNSASPALKLVISLMSIFTIGIIVWFIGFLVFRLVFSIDVPEANEILFGNISQLNTAQLKFSMVIQTLGFFVIPGVFLQWLFSTPEASYFNINQAPKIASRLLVALTLVASIPFINFLLQYNQNLPVPSFLSEIAASLRSAENASRAISTQLLTVATFGGFVVNVLVIALIPAIGEEFVFRGVFQKIFQNATQNKHMAIVLAAILFSAIHGEFFSFIPRFALGLFFGYLMVWSNTIWLPVFAHFINNLIVVSIYYLSGSGASSFSPDKMEGGFFQVWGILVSLVLCGIGVYFVKRLETSKI